MTNILKIPYLFVRPFYEKTEFHNGVIWEVRDEKLAAAYSYCREITRRFAKTFYMAIRFLPNHKQRGIFAIYSLCRYIDHLVDEAEDLILEKKIRADCIAGKLDSFEENLLQTYEGKTQTDPILIAFADMLKEHHVPLKYPLLLLEGVRMDQRKKRFSNFDELYDYSYKVAGIVGLMIIEVFGYSQKSAKTHATALGVAMQLTNILRDVGEDLQKGRIYLPLDELAAYNIPEKELRNRQVSKKFVGLMKFQIQRARRFYEAADKGIPMLERDSRFTVSLARENYSRILNKIEENRFDVFSQRAFLNTREKISALPKATLRLKGS